MTLDRNTEQVVVTAAEAIRGSKAAMLRIMLTDADKWGCTVSITSQRNGSIIVQCEHSEACPAHLS